MVERLITDSRLNLAASLQEFWVREIPFHLRQAISTPLPRFEELWMRVVVVECLKIITVETLLSHSTLSDV